MVMYRSLHKVIVCYVLPSVSHIGRRTLSDVARRNRGTLQLRSSRHLCSAPPEMESIVIDVRSDTVTKPSEGMRKAISEAVVGDDVYKEDPTVNELEKKVAALLGKDAALLVPSGTMGNLISVMVHCNVRGAEILVGDLSHIFYHEQGGVSQIAGVHPRTLKTHPDGTFDLDEMVQKIRSDTLHEPITSLLCIENTHNKCGGRVLPLNYLEKLGAIKQQIQIPIHLDGARLFNAAAHLKVPLSELTKHVDSVSVCLSKGLGAPIGSVIAGTKLFINKALRIRKALGGGMRQAGIIAAAGIYALDNSLSRLKEDHENTKLLAEGINKLNSEKIKVDLENVQSNILMINLSPHFMNSKRICQRLLQVTENEKAKLKTSIVVKMYPFEIYQVRAVMHLGINPSDIENIVKKMEYVINEPIKK